jgi:hypothetical protein
MSSTRRKHCQDIGLPYTSRVPLHTRLTAVALSLAFLAAGSLPCGVSGFAVTQVAVEAGGVPSSVVHSAAHPAHASEGAHATHASRASHANHTAAPAHAEHPGSADGRKHANHRAHAADSNDIDPSDETLPFIDAPCPCGCSQPNEAAPGGTTRVGFALARADWARAVEVAPLAHAAPQRAFPAAPDALLDPVPI